MTAPVGELRRDEVRPGATRTDVGDGSAHPLAWTMLAFGAIALVVWVVVWWSVLHPPTSVPVGTPVPGAADLPTWLRGWVHWDAGWYASISQDGYRYQPGVASSVAFFPLYPMVIRLLSVAGPAAASPLAVGIGVTLASGAAGMALLWTWCRSRVDAPTATTAVLLLAVYPYAIYLYGPVYADALFFAGVLGAFVLLERDHVIAATLVGAAAGAARPAGLILAVALLIRLVEIRSAQREAVDPSARSWSWTRRWNPAGLRPRDRVIVGASTGFIAYCIYLDARFGDPFAFATTQGAPGWDQPAGPTTWFKSAMFAEVAQHPWGPAAIGLVVQAALVVVVLVAAPFVGRRLGWAYAWFMVLVAVMVSVGSKDFQGAGRYLIPAMAPIALLAAGVLGRHRIARAAVMGTGFVLLLFFASWFAKGNYLA